jgi:hypothetical protein
LKLYRVLFLQVEAFAAAFSGCGGLTSAQINKVRSCRRQPLAVRIQRLPSTHTAHLLIFDQASTAPTDMLPTQGNSKPVCMVLQRVALSSQVEFINAADSSQQYCVDQVELAG